MLRAILNFICIVRKQTAESCCTLCIFGYIYTDRTLDSVLRITTKIYCQFPRPWLFTVFTFTFPRFLKRITFTYFINARIKTRDRFRQSSFFIVFWEIHPFIIIIIFISVDSDVMFIFILEQKKLIYPVA